MANVVAKKYRQTYWLTKDNKLIQFHANLTATDYKIVNYVMYKAVQENRVTNLRIPASELVKFANIKGTNYGKVLLQEAQKIVKTTVTIQEPDGTKWKVHSLMPDMEYENGYLECGFNHRLESYILGEMKTFTRGEYGQLAECKSFPAMRLYEICNSWKNKGKVFFDVEEWRQLLGATTKSYDVFSQFKKVITAAVKEVNSKTDINVEPEYIKQGRAVKQIKFLITKKDRDIEQLSDKTFAKSKPGGKTTYKKRHSSLDHDNSDSVRTFDVAEADCLKRMEEIYGLDNDIATRAMVEHGLVYCQSNMEYVRKAKLAGQVRNPGGYLVQALEHDYAGSRQSSEMAKTAEEAEHADKARWNRTAAKGVIPAQEDLSNIPLEPVTEDGAKLLRDFGVVNEKYIARWSGSYPAAFLQKTFTAMRKNDNLPLNDMDYIDTVLRYNYKRA